MPVLILSLKDETRERRPAIVFLHSSYKCKEWLRPLLKVKQPLRQFHTCPSRVTKVSFFTAPKFEMSLMSL